MCLHKPGKRNQRLSFVIAFDTTSKPIRFVASHLEKVLLKSGQSVKVVPLSADATTARRFSWTKYLPQVERDIKLAEEIDPAYK